MWAKCDLCDQRLANEGSGLDVLKVKLYINNESKKYFICSNCIEKVVRKVKTMGFVGSFIRHQLPKDLFPFLERNAPKLIKGKHGGLKRNE